MIEIVFYIDYEMIMLIVQIVCIDIGFLKVDEFIEELIW